MLTQIDSNTFSDFIKSNTVVVVDFWAEWCGPCKIMEPVIAKVSEELALSVKFGAVNVDEQSDLASRQAIMSIPTMIIYANGIEVDRIIGARSAEKLKSEVSKYIV